MKSKPLDNIGAIGIDGKLYPVESLGKKQRREIEKRLAKNEKSNERALNAANKMLKPKRIRWGRILIATIIAAPGSFVAMGAIGSCIAAELAKKSAIIEPQKTTEEFTQPSEPESPTDWYFNPSDKKARDILIMESFKEKLEELTIVFLNSDVTPGEWGTLEMNFHGVDFINRMKLEIDQEKQIAYLHVELHGAETENPEDQFHWKTVVEFPMDGTCEPPNEKGIEI
jgi:hypothetical protein